MTLLLVACGVPCGFAVRRRLAHVLPRLVRAQMLLLATPLAFTAGLVFVPRFDAVAAMATLVTAEAAGVFAGGLLNERDGTQRVSLTASSSNTGIWAIPIAGVFLGPAAVSFVAVFDQMSFPRGLVLTSRLRRFAPTPQAARTALVDYAPEAALVCGLVLHGLLGRPDALAPWLPRIGIASAVASMLLIGAALPSTRPQAVHARHALLGGLFRFVPATVGLTLLYLLGVHPPAAAWLLAFAPSYYSMLTLSRLYGYDGREGWPRRSRPRLLLPGSCRSSCSPCTEFRAGRPAQCRTVTASSRDRAFPCKSARRFGWVPSAAGGGGLRGASELAPMRVRAGSDAGGQRSSRT